MKHIASSLFILSVAIACGRPTQQSQLQEAWNAKNDPSILAGVNYEAEFSKLPLSGTAEQKGWSDDYWPTYRGGISYRWVKAETSYDLIDPSSSKGVTFTELSPAEKFDLLMNRNDFPTVMSERRRTRVLRTVQGSPDFDPEYSIPGWEGICHGWAPAALNFKEPKKEVTMDLPSGNKVTFYPSDVKALLSYYQQESSNRSTRTEFVSERCGLDFAELDKKLAAGEITQEEWKAQVDSNACRDINAASFHLILANELGFKKLGFVVDVTRDDEVWNQPTNSFESSVTRDSNTPAAEAAPGTVREIDIKTRMYYTVEMQPSMVAPAAPLEDFKDYAYTLELDDSGKVIGGRWISADRPDFAWRESTPIFQGYFRSLKKIYEQSIQP